MPIGGFPAPSTTETWYFVIAEPTAGGVQDTSTAPSLSKTSTFAGADGFPDPGATNRVAVPVGSHSAIIVNPGSKRTGSRIATDKDFSRNVTVCSLSTGVHALSGSANVITS